MIRSTLDDSGEQNIEFLQLWEDLYYFSKRALELDLDFVYEAFNEVLDLNEKNDNINDISDDEDISDYESESDTKKAQSKD